MKPRIVFLGNALASALYHAWLGCIIGSSAYDSIWVNYQHVSDSDVAAIRMADVVVLQVSDIEGFDIEGAGTRARIIRFPYVNGSFLWPYAGQTHPRWGETPMHICGAFAGECGDGFLAQLFMNGATARDAVAAYAELDIVRTARIERRFEIGLETQRLRDQKAGFDISIADYISDNIESQPLFISRQNLAKPLFWHLARIVFSQLLKELGDCERKVDQAERLHHISLWGLLEMPIHPGIVSYFHIPGRDPAYKFRVNRSRLTFDDYASDYINGIYQIDIFEGIRLLDSGQYEAAEAHLTRGIKLAPSSPDAAAAMSRLLAHLGRKQEALEYACASVHLDTDDQRNLTLLAERYLDLGWHSAARAAIERSLEIHFFDWHSNQLLIDLCLRSGDSTRALSLACHLGAMLPDHHSAQFRLCQLYLQHGMLDSAEDALRRLHEAASSSPRDGRPHADLGYVFWTMGRIDKATAEFTTAISLEPDREDFKAALSTLLVHSSQK